MCDEKREMKLRCCYDKNGALLDNNTQIVEYVPLRELLDMFMSIHKVNISVPLEEVG